MYFFLRVTIAPTDTASWPWALKWYAHFGGKEGALEATASFDTWRARSGLQLSLL